VGAVKLEDRRRVERRLLSVDVEKKGRKEGRERRHK
jgi:hypothetical protein